jgi:hypothetical protein
MAVGSTSLGEISQPKKDKGVKKDKGIKSRVG